MQDTVQGYSPHIIVHPHTRSHFRATFCEILISERSRCSRAPLALRGDEGPPLAFSPSSTIPHCMKDMVRNRSEKFRDIVLVTTQNFHRCSGSAPPRLFASHLSPRDRMHSSSQKIFPTVPLCSPALLTQPQRRNTDVRGRSYHILKLFTPRQIRRFGRIRRYAQIWWSGAKRATHFVCNLSRRISDFPFCSSRKARPRRAKEPGPGR